jgi:hypothetical protein
MGKPGVIVAVKVDPMVPSVSGGTTHQWTPRLAYVVGLIASDGSLPDDGGHEISFKSTDLDLVQQFLACLERPERYWTVPAHDSTIRGRQIHNRVAFYTRFTDRHLFAWLRSIGISPMKSRTLGALDIPDAHLFDFVRGVLDGDGSILVVQNRPDPRKRPEYTVTRLRVVLYSGSRPFLAWLQQRLETHGIRGSIVRVERTSGLLYHLVYSRRASVRLLSRLYSDESGPSLRRKRAIWHRYVAVYGLVQDRRACRIRRTLRRE